MNKNSLLVGALVFLGSITLLSRPNFELWNDTRTNFEYLITDNKNIWCEDSLLENIFAQNSIDFTKTNKLYLVLKNNKNYHYFSFDVSPQGKTRRRPVEQLFIKIIRKGKGFAVITQKSSYFGAKKKTKGNLVLDEKKNITSDDISDDIGLDRLIFNDDSKIDQLIFNKDLSIILDIKIQKPKTGSELYEKPIRLKMGKKSYEVRDRINFSIPINLRMTFFKDNEICIENDSGKLFELKFTFCADIAKAKIKAELIPISIQKTDDMILDEKIEVDAPFSSLRDLLITIQLQGQNFAQTTLSLTATQG